MKKTYHGSCHCKAITFEADLDFSQGTSKCNCTFCWKQRMWKVPVERGDFRLLSGEGVMADYGKSGDWGEGHHIFCPQCGIATHGFGNIPEAGGEYMNVHVSALDDLPVDELLAGRVTYMDGLHDNWFNAPKENRHL